ncbi:MAG: hypothetical protein Q9201_000594 [Fulgogasparrea decipioides]
MGGTPQIASRSNNPPAFLLGAIPMKENPKGKAPNPVPAGYQDPFVTPKPGSTSASSSEVPKLSPVAPTFTPLRLISNTSEGILSNTLKSTKYRSRLHLVVENLPVTGIVYVSFTDVRDAIEVVSALRNFRGEWLVQYLPVPSYALNPQEGSSKGISASLFEGQLLVKADFSGPAVYFDTDTVGRLILDLLNNYGVIMAYEAVVAAHPVVAYRAEFYDTKDADHAMACTINVQLYRGEVPLIVDREDTDLESRFHHLGLESGTGTWITQDVRHLAIRCKHLATAPLFHQAFRRLACRRLLGTGSMLLRSGQVQWAKYNIVRYCLPGATVTIQGASSDTEDVIFKITQVGTTT